MGLFDFLYKEYLPKPEKPKLNYGAPKTPQLDVLNYPTKTPAVTGSIPTKTTMGELGYHEQQKDFTNPILWEKWLKTQAPSIKNAWETIKLKLRQDFKRTIPDTQSSPFEERLGKISDAAGVIATIFMFADVARLGIGLSKEGINKINKIKTLSQEYKQALDVFKKFGTSPTKEGYRELVKTYHPDITGGTTENMEKINSAYEAIEKVKKLKNGVGLAVRLLRYLVKTEQPKLSFSKLPPTIKDIAMSSAEIVNELQKVGDPETIQVFGNKPVEPSNLAEYSAKLENNYIVTNKSLQSLASLIKSEISTKDINNILTKTKQIVPTSQPADFEEQEFKKKGLSNLKASDKYIYIGVRNPDVFQKILQAGKIKADKTSENMGIFASQYPAIAKDYSGKLQRLFRIKFTNDLKTADISNDTDKRLKQLRIGRNIDISDAEVYQNGKWVPVSEFIKKEETFKPVETKPEKITLYHADTGMGKMTHAKWLTASEQYAKTYGANVQKEEVTIDPNKTITTTYTPAKDPLEDRPEFEFKGRKFNFQLLSKEDADFLKKNGIEAVRVLAGEDMPKLGIKKGDIYEYIELSSPEEPKQEKTETSLDDIETALKKRKIKGDTLLNTINKIDEILSADPHVQIDKTGYITLYHKTTPENANKIIKDGEIVGKEDSLFFGTEPSGQINGYGDATVKVKVPIESVEIDNVFPGEVYLSVPLTKKREIKIISTDSQKTVQPTNYESFLSYLKSNGVKNATISKINKTEILKTAKALQKADGEKAKEAQMPYLMEAYQLLSSNKKAEVIDIFQNAGYSPYLSYLDRKTKAGITLSKQEKSLSDLITKIHAKITTLPKEAKDFVENYLSKFENENDIPIEKLKLLHKILQKNEKTKAAQKSLLHFAHLFAETERAPVKKNTITLYRAGEGNDNVFAAADKAVSDGYENTEEGRYELQVKKSDIFFFSRKNYEAIKDDVWNRYIDLLDERDDGTLKDDPVFQEYMRLINTGHFDAPLALHNAKYNEEGLFEVLNDVMDKYMSLPPEQADYEVLDPIIPIMQDVVLENFGKHSLARPYGGGVGTYKDSDKAKWEFIINKKSIIDKKRIPSIEEVLNPVFKNIPLTASLDIEKPIGLHQKPYAIVEIQKDKWEDFAAFAQKGGAQVDAFLDGGKPKFLLLKTTNKLLGDIIDKYNVKNPTINGIKFEDKGIRYVRPLVGKPTRTFNLTNGETVSPEYVSTFLQNNLDKMQIIRDAYRYYFVETKKAKYILPKEAYLIQRLNKATDKEHEWSLAFKMNGKLKVLPSSLAGSDDGTILRIAKVDLLSLFTKSNYANIHDNGTVFVDAPLLSEDYTIDKERSFNVGFRTVKAGDPFDLEINPTNDVKRIEIDLSEFGKHKEHRKGYMSLNIADEMLNTFKLIFQRQATEPDLQKNVMLTIRSLEKMKNLSKVVAETYYQKLHSIIGKKANPKFLKVVDDYLDNPDKYAVAFHVLPKEYKTLAATIKYEFEELAGMAKSFGILETVKENYTPYLYLNKDELFMRQITTLGGKLGTSFKMAKKRKFNTKDEAREAGLQTLDDPILKIQIYVKQMFDTVANRLFIDELKKLKTKDGLPAVMAKPKSGDRDAIYTFNHVYVTLEDRQLSSLMFVPASDGKGILVRVPLRAHPEIANLINGYFKPHYAYSVPKRVYLSLRGMVKRGIFFNPLIHGINMIGVKLAIATFGNPFSRLTKENYQKYEDWAIQSGMVVSGYSNQILYRMLDAATQNKPKSFQYYISRVLRWNDWLLWDKIVPSAQVGSFYQITKILKEAHPEWDKNKIGKYAADFLNPLYGTMPESWFPEIMREVGSVLFLAFKWTASNLDLIVKSGTGGRGLGSITMDKRERRWVWKMNLAYLLRSLALLFIGANLLQLSVLKAKHELYKKGILKEDTDVHSTFDNELSKNPLNLFAVTFGNKDVTGAEEYYSFPLFRWARDVVAWFASPRQTFINKMEPLLKTSIELVTNYSTWRHTELWQKGEQPLDAIENTLLYVVESITPSTYITSESRGIARTLPFLGMWVSHGAKGGDIQTLYYQYLSRKRAHNAVLDRKIDKLLKQGDIDGAIILMKNSKRYTTNRAIMYRILEFKVPIISAVKDKQFQRFLIQNGYTLESLRKEYYKELKEAHIKP